MEASQLAVENTAKAVIAVARIPSWSHDPSSELLEIMDKLPKNKWKMIEELAKLVHELAPEHGLTTYGKPSEGLTPWEIYDERKALEALKKSRKALQLTRKILRGEN